ncbi:hypothetical protein L3X17_18360 [Pseudomonas stutzeri]|nr:hypothetical protein [Stutzerimonas stutzeri]
MMTQEKWLTDVLDRLNPPQETILTDPADTKKVLENLNMSGCRFQHVDGEVRMGLYVPCADPETKEGVGLAVIFLGDDTRLYRRAASIQGVDLEKAAIEVLGDYMKTFHNPGVDFSAAWKADGYAILAIHTNMWAAIKVVDGVEFWVTDEDQSDNPNPNETLTVGAYVPNSCVWLEFDKHVANKVEADQGLSKWAAQLQDKLAAAQPQKPKPSLGMRP